MSKLEYVDGLRGFAIIGVIMIHTNQYGNSKLQGVIGDVIGEGARGVQLFFLISSFTLFLSFKNRLNMEVFPVRNFFLRRFFRIAPIYYLGICYYLLQDGFGPRYWLGDHTNISFLNIFFNILFLHGFNPYWITSVVPGGWTIGIEITFYAILPLLISRIKNINQAFNFFITSLIFNFLFTSILLKFPLISFERLWHEYLFFYFPSQLPVFCLGIMLYYFICKNCDISNVSGKSLLVFSGLVLAQLATGASIIPNHTLFGIAFFILSIALSKFRFKAIINPIICYVGKISFSMYIVHFAVLHWLTYFNFIDYLPNSLINYLVRFFIVSFSTVLISTVLYNLIEIKFQKLGKKIIDNLEKKHETLKAISGNKAIAN